MYLSLMCTIERKVKGLVFFIVFKIHRLRNKLFLTETPGKGLLGFFPMCYRKKINQQA